MTVNTTLLFTKGHEDQRAWIMSDWPNFFARAFSVKVSCIIIRTSVKQWTNSVDVFTSLLTPNSYHAGNLLGKLNFVIYHKQLTA